jgi:predicted small lipoprotein YifL
VIPLIRLILISSLLCLCACGVKRDLKLPKDEQQQESNPALILPEKSMPDIDAIKNPVYDPSLRRTF